MGKCVSSCSKIQINDTCAEFCENGLFLDENECVMQCSKHKFVYMRTKQSLICLETCPNQMVANTTGECMEMDECKDFIYKGRCQSTCPSFSFIVDKDQYKYCSSLEISYILFSLSVLILIAVVLFVSWIIARRCSASMKQKKFLSKESIYDKGDKHYITNVDLAIPKKVSKPNSGRENLAFSGSSTREAEFEETRL
ncbi:uncharacterized protein LOC134242433 [Saccostrea cucullata]|uniref:uncharacterized protein LOC134242433 n=1 Tax=Saccostrea cuccullata TaxID=36930 RepID=UPI002ED2B9FE